MSFVSGVFPEKDALSGDRFHRSSSAPGQLWVDYSAFLGVVLAIAIQFHVCIPNDLSFYIICT